LIELSSSEVPWICPLRDPALDCAQLCGDSSESWLRHIQSATDTANKRVFPGRVSPRCRQLNRLLDRLVGYAPWSQAPRLEIALLDTEGDSCASSGSCGCGSGDGGGERSGLVEAHPDGYLVWIQTRTPLVPKTLVSGSRPGGWLDRVPERIERSGLRTSEMAAVACGFGVC